MTEQRTPPPVPKYTLTLRITGNSHAEIEDELHGMTRGGYLLDSDYNKRDSFHVVGGRSTRILEHTNPEQTPEAYKEQLSDWFHKRTGLRE